MNITKNVLGKIKLKKIGSDKKKPKKLKNKDIDSKKIKFKKRYIFIGLILIIILWNIVKMFIPDKIIVTNYNVLEKSSIEKSVNVAGKIKSEEVVNVYSDVSSIVSKINVQAGDKVKKGDVLAVLDSKQIEREISKLRQEIERQKRLSSIDLESKERAYENKLYLHENNIDSAISSAEENLRIKENLLEQKQNDYEYNEILLQYGEISEQELKSFKEAYESAIEEYEQAEIEVETTKLNEEDELKSLKENLDIATISANDKSNDIMLEQKEEDLVNCKIKAPVNGTITSVRAVEGQGSGGILFTIEDLENLYVELPIKESDVLNVKKGQEVEVKIDVIENGEPIKGEVTRISDTAVSSGENNNQNVFIANVKLKECSEDIKVGMTCRAEIIVEKADDAFAVPFECIMEDKDTRSVYVAEPNGKGQYIISEIPVNIGIETDFNIQICGEKLKDKMIILNNSTYPVGSKIELANIPQSLNKMEETDGE